MRFIERYFYRPSVGQKALALALSPLSILYCAMASARRRFSRACEFPAAIISVGNLIVGGTGKTPFIIALAKEYGAQVAVVSRGYKRRSKGLLVVSHEGEILQGAEKSGDEAQLFAQKLPQATIIVSENRERGIQKALELGKKIIFLDDGFRFPYKKLNLVLQPLLEPHFRLCIPSGAYRERPSLYASADILAREGRDYKREVNIENPSARMLLVTAIANPSRLDRFLPEVVGRLTYTDHHFFDSKELKAAMEAHEASSILITEKDEVKLQESGLPLSVMRLELKIDEEIVERVRGYIATRLRELA